MKRINLWTAAAVAAFTLNTMGGALAAIGVWDGAAGPGSGIGDNATHPWIASATGPYAEWNIFNVYPTDATPDIAGAGSITETTGGGFLTSGGNVYSFSAATDFDVTLSGATAAPSYNVYLRIASLGTEALPTATLNGIAATAVETFSGAASQGLEKELLWTWTGVAPGSTYTFNFGASGSSLSLDQVAVYATGVAAVPEPGTWALMAAGLVAIGAIARRRVA
jgi:hypothetical protein